MGLDLNKKNLTKLSDVGYEFELVIPEINESTDAFITVLGSKSKVVQDFSRKKYNELQTKRALDRKKRGQEEEMTLDEAEKFSVEAAAVRVIGWRGMEEDGVEVAFTPENVKRILKDHAWIRERIMEESDFLGNFIKS